MKELVTRDDFEASGLLILHGTLTALSDEGWHYKAQLLQEKSPDGAVLEAQFTDYSQKGELGELPFWRIVKACDGTRVSTILCRSHGMGSSEQRKLYSFLGRLM